MPNEAPTPTEQHIKPPLLSKMIFDLLRERIISGRLKPGQRVNELEIQREMGTSRSPIREALRHLELEGLVEIQPRRGAFVRQLSAEDLHEAILVRAQLESLAADLAAQFITAEQLQEMKSLLAELDEALSSRNIQRYTEAHYRFHQAFIRASGNQTLQRHLRLVTQPFVITRLTYIYLMSQGPDSEVGHHELYEALSRRDRDLAADIARRHVLALLDLQEKDGEEK